MEAATPPNEQTPAEAAPTPADIAAATIGAFNRAAVVTAPGRPNPNLERTKFDRLSVERRVLGHVTDEVNLTALGPRNTLAAITYDLMTDRNTTHPDDDTLPRLEVAGKTVADIAQQVHDHLEALAEAGLVAVREDGSYAVTPAGWHELSI